MWINGISDRQLSTLHGLDSFSLNHLMDKQVRPALKHAPPGLLASPECGLVRNDVLGQGDEPVPAVGRTVRFRTIPRPLLELTASELLLLLLLFFPGISSGQESPDPPLNHAQSERKPFISDVTIWTAQTV